METKQLTVADYRETGAILDRMRKYLIVLFIADIVVFVLLTLTAIIINLNTDTEMTFFNSVLEFLSKRTLLLSLITMIPSLATVMYCIAMLRLHIFEKDLMVAGIVAFFLAVYQRTIPTISTSEADSTLSTAVGGGFLVLILGIAFRKLYCDAMQKATKEMDPGIGEGWKGLWKLSLVVNIVAILMLVVLNYVAQDVIKKVNEASFLWYDYDGSGLDYVTLVRRLTVIALLLANIATIAEVIVMAFEMKCLKKTRAGVIEKCCEAERAEAAAAASEGFDANL